MDNLTLARMSMGTSLMFHIIFAALGIGLPLLLVISEGLGRWRKDQLWLELARRWSKALAILFAVGAVSGTVLSFELGLLWPKFMAFSGSLVGLPFTAEGFAFFIEAIFLALYIYGWDRLTPLQHWLCSLPLAISGAASAIFVVMVNGWMNTPSGFQLSSSGQLVKVDPLAAALNPSVPTEDPHMLFAAYTMTGFIMAGIYAVGMLRGRLDALHRRAVAMGMALGGVAIALTVIWGDLSARFVYLSQPAKFAAMEALFETQQYAPITLGGWVSAAQEKVWWGLQIPGLLSWLATFNVAAPVRGLNTFAPTDRPNPLLVHISFDTMVSCGLLMVLIALAFWGLALWKRQLPDSRFLLCGIVLAAPISVIALEAGWLVTEFGRQPWVVNGILRTANSATTAPALGPSFLIFLVIYLLLAFTTVQLLLHLVRSRRGQS